VGTVNTSVAAAVPAAVRIVAIQPAGQGQYQLTLAGDTSHLYLVQASVDLKNWAGIAAKPASNNPLDLIDADAPKFKARFYRAFQLP
jgi:hypothetical protein